METKDAIAIYNAGVKAGFKTGEAEGYLRGYGKWEKEKANDMNAMVGGVYEVLIPADNPLTLPAEVRDILKRSDDG